MKLTQNQQQALLKVMITSQVNLHYLEELQRAGIVYAARDVKRQTNLLINKLSKKEKAFDALFNHAEESVSALHDAYFDLIESLSKVEFHHYGELKAVIDEFRSNKKS